MLKMLLKTRGVGGGQKTVEQDALEYLKGNFSLGSKYYSKCEIKAGPEPMAREKALAIYRQFAKNNTGLELTDEAVEHAYASLFETNEVVGAMITDDEAYMSEYLENIINEHIEEMERNLEMKISEFTKIDQPALFKANASVVPYEGKNYYIYTGYSY